MLKIAAFLAGRHQLQRNAAARVPLLDHGERLGKITSYKNWQSCEDVQYQYDITSILPAKRSALATYCHAPLAGLRTLCGAGRLTRAAAKGLVIRPVTLGSGVGAVVWV
jgi:hypothetical protein